MRSFASAHNDYLDHDRHNHEDREGEEPAMAWGLWRIDNGKETRIGTFCPRDGQDVMGCDMHEWMLESGHYGNESPDDYEWDGDSNSVAVMARRPGIPEYRFEWQAAGEAETKGEDQ